MDAPIFCHICFLFANSCRTFYNLFFSYLSSQTEETYLLQQYIIQQLFLIIRTYDLSDSYSCRSVQKLVEYFLKNADLIDDTIEVIAGMFCFEIKFNINCKYLIGLNGMGHEAKNKKMNTHIFIITFDTRGLI